MHGNLPLLIDFYEGAYGPTIRIDCCDKEQIERLKNIFSNLALGEIESLRPNDSIPIKCSNLDQILMILLPKNLKFKDITNTVEIRNENNLKCAVWSRTSEGWLLCKDLCDGLINSKRDRGHQYLVDEGESECIIELCLNE